jgi:hypothetical protein
VPPVVSASFGDAGTVSDEGSVLPISAVVIEANITSTSSNVSMAAQETDGSVSNEGSSMDMEFESKVNTDSSVEDVATSALMEAQELLGCYAGMAFANCHVETSSSGSTTYTLPDRGAQVVDENLAPAVSQGHMGQFCVFDSSGVKKQTIDSASEHFVSATTSEEEILLMLGLSDPALVKNYKEEKATAARISKKELQDEKDREEKRKRLLRRSSGVTS